METPVNIISAKTVTVQLRGMEYLYDGIRRTFLATEGPVLETVHLGMAAS